eukprot:scaffold98576_cov59-Phaeocystis_antarctica.AAC.1
MGLASISPRVIEAAASSFLSRRRCLRGPRRCASRCSLHAALAAAGRAGARGLTRCPLHVARHCAWCRPSSIRHSLCGGVRQDVEYRFYCEFQSHEPEFDYLKSLEIEERINKIRWCKGRAGPLFLLSTNDKTIKLWKIYEKKVRMVTS